MATLLIIADDLSGTADCAVGLATCGLRTVVTLSASVSPSADADVIAADADSRRLAPAAAAQVNVAMWQAHAHQARFVYKKIDSTLRGNVAAEVAALIPHAGMALVAPAFPATGRTTRHGCQLLNGVPVEDTEVWHNEGITGRADLTTMFEAQGLRTALVDLTELRDMSEHALSDRFSELQAEGIEALIIDSETDQDLALIAQASRHLVNSFWVGSAGLAAQLAEALDFRVASPPTVRSPRVSIKEPAKGPTLTVVGSMSQVSQRQAGYLRERLGETLATFEVRADLLREAPWTAAQRSFAKAVDDALTAGRDVLITLVQEEARNAAEGLTLCTHLGQLLAPSLTRPSALIATGGETARALLCAAGIDQLRVIEEIETGMPLSQAELMQGSESSSLSVITKAGGFGHPHTLFNAWRHLAGSQRSGASLAGASTDIQALHCRKDHPS